MRSLYPRRHPHLAPGGTPLAPRLRLLPQEEDDGRCVVRAWVCACARATTECACACAYPSTSQHDTTPKQPRAKRNHCPLWVGGGVLAKVGEGFMGEVDVLVRTHPDFPTPAWVACPSSRIFSCAACAAALPASLCADAAKSDSYLAAGSKEERAVGGVSGSWECGGRVGQRLDAGGR
eukprot:scaffold20768_cov118-Isochrysis_galbana.AAC.2